MGYIGIMENKMETTMVYWGYIGIMEEKMGSRKILMVGLQSLMNHCTSSLHMRDLRKHLKVAAGTVIRIAIPICTPFGGGLCAKWRPGFVIVS